MLCDTLQDEALVFGRLVATAHAQIDRREAIGVHGAGCSGYEAISE
jgi:hypothetical protein